MRWMGAKARVLDGGLAAWRAAGQAVEAGAVERTPSQVAVTFDPTMVLYTPQLRVELASGQAVLIDARAAARYRGEVEPIDPVAGRIPGARNHPFADNTNADKHWRPASELRQAFASIIGVTDPAQVVHMCGSGVTACHNLLAMEQAGLHGSRLYAPSWSGWISDPGNPVAVGGVDGAPTGSH